MMHPTGRDIFEPHLEKGEELVLFARGQLHTTLGGQRFHGRLPLTRKSPICLIGVTDRRVLLGRLLPRRYRWADPYVVSVPPVTAAEVHVRRAFIGRYIKLSLGGVHYRLYLDRGYREAGRQVAESLRRFSPNYRRWFSRT
jgi:hypothetical protein